MFEAEKLSDKRKFLLFSFAAFLILLASHAVTAMFAALVLLAYFIYRMSDRADREGIKPLFSRKFSFALAALIVLAVASAFVLFWKGSFADTLSMFSDMLFFEKGFTSFELSYSPILFYGPFSFILAMVGIVSSLKNKKKMIFALWFAAAAILLFIYSFTNVSFFAPYPRLFYYFLLCLAPLSAFGVSALFSMIKKITKARLKIILSAILILFVLLSLLTSLAFYYKTPEGIQLYKVIDDSDYRAIKWLGDNYGKGNVVLAMPHVSSAIYPISRNYVLAIVPTRLGGGNVEEIESFFSADCSGKKALLEKYMPDFIFSKEKIDCGFKEIYSDNAYIYDARIF